MSKEMPMTQQRDDRTIQTPEGDVAIKQPRLRERRPDETRETFRSAILPSYRRKTQVLKDLLP